MKRSKKVFGFVSFLVIVNVATLFVVRHNYKAGFYRPNADIIAIPIFSTVWLSFLVSPLLAILALVPDSAMAKKLLAQRLIHRIIASFVLTILYLVCAVVAFFGAAYWFGPGHYPLSVILAVAFIWVMSCMASDIRRLFCSSAHGVSESPAKTASR